MRALYPAYLERPAEGLPIGERARVPAGTIVEVTGRASTELYVVSLMSGRDTARLSPAGHAFHGRFRPRATGSWTWNATGAAGKVTDVPASIELEVVPDSVPRPEILTPRHDTLVSPNEHVTLRLSAVDDHGVASVDIVSWRTREGKDDSRAVARVATVDSTPATSCISSWSRSTTRRGRSAARAASSSFASRPPNSSVSLRATLAMSRSLPRRRLSRRRRPSSGARPRQHRIAGRGRTMTAIRTARTA